MHFQKKEEPVLTVTLEAHTGQIRDMREKYFEKRKNEFLIFNSFHELIRCRCY